MKSENTENTATTEPTDLNETELENVNGGAAINLDAFITVLNHDSLRNMVGMDRPKGIYVNTNIRELNIQELSNNLRGTRGL